MEYPQTFRNDDGAEVIAINDTQARVFEKSGFKPIERSDKRTRQQ